jgi:GEVED domain/Secretion system C-terminal sorting domain
MLSFFGGTGIVCLPPTDHTTYQLNRGIMQNLRKNTNFKTVKILNRCLYVFRRNNNNYILYVKYIVGCKFNIYDFKSKPNMKQQVTGNAKMRVQKLMRFPFVAAFLIMAILLPFAGTAQCGAGYNQVTLDWDNLDYFSYTGNYVSGSGYLTSNSQAQTQYFAFGTQRLTIVNNYAAANNLGENALHTGDAGSYGVGSQDINFNGNGTVTFTFETEVMNLKFSIFDLDNSQSVNVTAVNAASVSQIVTMAKTNAASALVIAGSGGVSPIATSVLVGAVASNVNTASLNIDIAGPVKTITITTNGTAGDYWLSNIIACSAGNFPTGYYNVSKPFTGQAGYVLHSFDDKVYAVNPANGVTKYIFTDPTGNVNSMGYDPYNRVLYYTNSLTADPGNDRAIKKYDFNTKTISTLIADVSTIGVPLVTATSGVSTRGTGVESGAAAFYNGSLYLGIETGAKNAAGNPTGASGREAVIWRIDFTGPTPTRASQVFAMPTDDGVNTILHDWADFVVNDGVLYDFDGAGVTTQTDVSHVNMTTAATTNYHIPSGWTPGQPTVDWAGNILQLYALTSGSIVPYVAPYNIGSGTIGTRTNLTSTPAYTPAIPSLGDAAEGFKPLSDFGDAPATYDPAAGDPAVHELDANLRLGAAESEEWVTRGQTVLANADNNEDGLGAAPSLLNFNGMVNYSVPNISVYNNTGANATLIAWLDYNMNGVFEAGEGRTATVPTSAAAQLITLNWTSIFVPSTAATATFLRIRLTSAANGMTTANMTGYMPNGEVEDYRVVLGINLPVEITNFEVQKGNGKTANLQWNTSGNIAENAAFEIERSADAQQWTKAGVINTMLTDPNTSLFSFNDAAVLSGKSYYRIKIVAKDGRFKYTDIRSIVFANIKEKITVSPNPATDYITVQLTAEHAAAVKIGLFDHSGKLVYQKNVAVSAGSNNIRLSDINSPAPGLYYIKINIGEESFTEKLIIAKN